MKKKGTKQGPHFGNLIKRLEMGEVPADTNAMLLSKISNQQDARGLLSYIRLIEKHLANGRDTLTVAGAASLLLAACRVYRRLDTTGQTSLLLTTNQGTYIVSVTDATIVGTLPTTKRTTGT